MTDIIAQFDLWSLLDITVIAFVIYHLFMLLRGTHAAQMLIGIAVVIISTSILSAVAPLTALNWLINKLYPSFIVIIVILFQDEFRHILRKLGKRSFMISAVKEFARHELQQIIDAVYYLAKRRTGALIVIERDIVLNQYIEMGVGIDARISKDLLISIFQPNSPIHDGAVTVRGNRITAAGCFLPLTKQPDLPPSYGTRHRAAIGVSQDTDAAVILVSEEHGNVSWVEDGSVQRNVDQVFLERRLKKLFIEHEQLNPTADK